MKKTFFLILSVLTFKSIFSQAYWQQQVNYNIDVSLNDQEKILDAFATIDYINNSPDTLYLIWFHLWPNAYKNDKTAYSNQLLENGNTAFYFSSNEQRGYINKLDFKVDGITSRLEDHPQHIDIVKLILPKPLAPKQQIKITTPFHVKLPFNFSRGGYDGETFQVTQWYPKPAMYDNKGWHPMPYLDQGEFYSNFGNFEVKITVPKDYVVAATGVLQNDDEKQWLKTKKQIPTVEIENKSKSPGRRTTTSNKGKNNKIANPVPASQVKKTLEFIQNNVHDFAWFANKDFIVDQDTCALPSGKVINVYSYYIAKHKEVWQNSLTHTKDAVRFFSAEVGEYPYEVVSVVQGPQSFGGGMEYPTITVIAPSSSSKELESTIVHEVGHNWFYGILASNERAFPWMDEGMTSFYDDKYQLHKYGVASRATDLLFQTAAIRKKDQPIATHSEEFSESNYGLVAYHKTAQWMKSIENIIGKDGFKNMMKEFFNTWKFKHPQPEDFKRIASERLGNKTEEVFQLLHNKGILPGNEIKGTTIISPFIKGSIKNYFQNPTQKAVLVIPILGANIYDKLMVGGLITNYTLPPSNFHYLFAPMYAFGSKSLTGLGKLAYTFHSEGFIRKTDLFINGSTFSMNQFRDTAGRQLIMKFQKVVPGARLTFKENNPRSTARKYLQWKTFLINEESLRIIPDTLISGTDTSFITQYLLPKNDRYLNQLQFVIENNRSLYPFNITIQLEQAIHFLRPSITANYFYNYSKGGGLEVRFFGGKFLYLNGRTIQKEFATDRYHLNMSGPNGYEDYTYSDYFVGRNEFQNVASQQLMIRDGAFKVRTDLLAAKVGKTDDWLLALNFNTSIPRSINPLSILPFKIPLRAFIDVGTYADAWDRRSNLDRFLFDAGFHIPLFGDVVNIYVPIVYSNVFSTYFKSTIPKNRFLKTMSFSINLYNKNLKKINQVAEF